jgi:hypothetical protein
MKGIPFDLEESENSSPKHTIQSDKKGREKKKRLE